MKAARKAVMGQRIRPFEVQLVRVSKKKAKAKQGSGDAAAAADDDTTSNKSNNQR